MQFGLEPKQKRLKKNVMFPTWYYTEPPTQQTAATEPKQKALQWKDAQLPIYRLVKKTCSFEFKSKTIEATRLILKS